MIRFFWVYGMAILLFMAWADFRGWSLTGYDETKGVPKSLRDNPGSYRSTYARTMHK
jgi:hypothetical protein